MPLVKSGDLLNEILADENDELLDYKDTLRDEFVYDTLIQILQALSFMHEGLHICHRDIKPQNIFIADSFEVKLADFGLSKHIINNKYEEEENDKEHQLLMTTTGMKGTLKYIAPE